MANKYVYLFKEGSADMRNLLGGKGANLAQMTSLGLPVPQGFTITTEACNRYYADGEKISDEIKEQILSALKETEKIIKGLEEEMQKAAKELDFERAMELRDVLFELKAKLEE